MDSNLDIYLIGLSVLVFLIITFLFVRKISNKGQLKVKIEPGASLENHYSLHRDELERTRISNNMKDVVRTLCLMCEEDNPVVLSRLRMHTKTAHGVPLSEYKKKFSIATERQHVLVEKVLHQCGLCGILLLLCITTTATDYNSDKNNRSLP